ncbi:MAG: alanine racemase [Acidobacteriaceae bacterium]
MALFRAHWIEWMAERGAIGWGWSAGMKSWVEISEGRLGANFRALREAAGEGTAVLAVVKANAYGHGVEVCAAALARAGAQWLGVGDVAEGVRVRRALEEAGITREGQPRILVMCGTQVEDAEEMLREGLTPAVSGIEALEWLHRVPEHGGSVGVHLEIDTGMCRQGVSEGGELERVLKWMAAHPSVRLEGVMTHFASAEIVGSAQTRSQRLRLEGAVRTVIAAGFRPEWIHAGSTSTLDHGGDEEGVVAWLRGMAAKAGGRSMVRAGLGLYGYCLELAAEAGSSAAVEHRVRPRLRPVMTWKTRVVGLREIEAGETIGYGAAFLAERKMRLALLPVGYADGLRREISGTGEGGGGWVMIEGKRAPIVGRVSMNLTVVDVTGLAEAVMGCEVVLLGEGVTADDHARVCGTIAYEIVCGVRAGRGC